jgi:integrase
LRESTRKSYRPAVRLFASRWATRSIDSIRYRDIERLHQELVDRPYVANCYVRVLHVMFEKAVQWEMFEGRNPARGIKLYRETKRKRYLSPEERVRLDDVLTEVISEYSNMPGKVRWSHVYAIHLLLLTGFRMSEVLDLEWSWIDRENLQIVLPDSKTGQSARVISPAVLELLDVLEQRRTIGVPWVLYGRHGQRINRSSLTNAWRRIRIMAKIEDVRCHDLRHSAASAAINAGCTLKEVGALLGHANPMTTARYAHLTNDAARAAARRMTDSIAAAKQRARAARTAKAKKGKK